MQLAPPEDQTPLRVRVKLTGSERRDFEDYQAYYRACFENDIDLEDLLTQLMAYAMRSDRDFLKWQKEEGAALRNDSSPQQR